METRLNWIDWAKAIGIMIVVFCHIPMHETIEKSFFLSFQMPLFFILSGFLHKAQPSFTTSIKKYWKTLIIPYFIFQLIIYPYWYIVQRFDGNDVSSLYGAIIKPILGCFIGVPINGVTWFIVALLLIKLYADYILRKENKVSYVIVSCFIVIIIKTIMDINQVWISFMFHSMLNFFPFFFIGHCLKNIDFFTTVKANRILLCLISIFLCIVTLYLSSHPISTLNTTGIILNKLKFYCVGLTGSITIILLCMLFNHVKNKIVLTISTGTIIIFGLHWMFIGTINFIMKKILNIIGDIKYTTLQAMLIVILITFICYFIILFCKKHFQIILGNRK